MKKRLPKIKFALLWRLMGDAELSASAKCVAVTLLLKFHNAKTGQRNPSFAALAKTLGRGQRAIFPAVSELVDSGWIEVISTKGGSSRSTDQAAFRTWKAAAKKAVA